MVMRVIAWRKWQRVVTGEYSTSSEWSVRPLYKLLVKGDGLGVGAGRVSHPARFKDCSGPGVGLPRQADRENLQKMRISCIGRVDS